MSSIQLRNTKNYFFINVDHTAPKKRTKLSPALGGVLLGLCVCIHLQSLAQNIGGNETVKDLSFLADRVKQFNPALPFYHPEFEREATKVIQEVTKDSVSIFRYLSLASRICALANEGHFKIGDREDIWRQGVLSDSYAYLPIQVKIISGKVFLLANFSDEQHINKGDELLAINGIPTQNILDSLLALTPSDGNIRTYAYRKIEDNFALLHFYHIEQPETYEIRLVDLNGEEKTVTVTALVRSDQVSNLKKYYPNRQKEKANEDEGFYSLDLNDHYAVLRLPSFDFRRVQKYKVKSKKLYQEIFRELQEANIKHLIIDLRDNTGGRNEFADDMIPFILQSRTTDEFFKKTTSWEGKEKVYKMPSPSKFTFKGALYVLVNGKTYSAGSSLAHYLKEYGDAKVIGTETGTRNEGFAAGSSQDITLPNTGLSIGIPRYHIAYPEPKKQTTSNRGLLPDHEIEATFDTYSDGTDLHMKKAIALIQQQPR